MEKKIDIPTLLVIKIALLLLFSICHVSIAKKHTYIIHMVKSKLPSLEDHTQFYTSSLASVSTAEIIYPYKNTIHGFSASLTEQEALAMGQREDVLSVRLDTIYQLHTTRTPHFLGLDNKHVKLPNLKAASKVIIGVLDTGFSPGSESYDDAGFGPVPNKWKGGCENASLSKCNKKLVGARYFMKGYESYLVETGSQFPKGESKSPVDTDGHGTHTSSTAGGSAVRNASLLGFGKGTARGMANLLELCP
ncbi:hypothetical protein CASFOL_038777 [Castilleja foliolosa]|uniref:Uncharacterized protein n=1 Tax=Castilleja foliolosa TaxID=1961234 RepID=A0ABD3BJH9_9LAMI